jgi:hypothetical protein
LADALERKPSGTATPAGNAGTTVTPVLSFGSKQNGVCREYRIAAESGPSFAGLACRKDEGIWRVAIHVETPKQAPVEGGYQTATGTSVPVVEALVDTMISGAAFGPEEEAAMLKQDWRTSP